MTLRAANIILAVIHAVTWFAFVLIIVRGRPFAVSKRASVRILRIVVGALYVVGVSLVLLGGYTFGCHSLRHLAGGFLDQFSRSTACYRAYACVNCFNRRHMMWAWLSLFWVGFTDLYVRLCSMGVWTDWKIL